MGGIASTTDEFSLAWRRTFAAMLLLLLSSGAQAAQQGSGVLQFHNSGNRAGAYVVPELTWASAPNLHRDTSFAGAVNGAVYAQPLYWLPTGAQTGQVIVATETNNVYALNAETGAVTWHTSLGTPVPGSALPCGNVNPVGVTGTPAIDPGLGTVYIEAAVMQGGAVRRKVFGLSLQDGSMLKGWPVDIASGLVSLGRSFSPSVQSQRSALAIYGGRLFVPYSGHFGDCGGYHGWVVGLTIGTPGVFGGWQTRAAKGGIWAPGGIAQADNDMYVATGNTAGASTWGDGEGIFRLTATLPHSASTADYFAPYNWKALDSSDADLGGTNPMPVNSGGKALILGLGKDGNAYLLDRTNLGGIGRAIAVTQVSPNPIRTAPAAYPGKGGAYVAFQGAGSACASNAQGLTVLRVTPTAVETAWCAALDGAGAPITTTSDGSSDRIVWIAGAEGDDRLHGFRGDTGASLFTGGGASDGMSRLRHFVTILAAEGHLYVAGDNQVYAFTAQ